MFENILDVLKTCQNKRNEITRNESCGQKRIGYSTNFCPLKSSLQYILNIFIIKSHILKKIQANN